MVKSPFCPPIKMVRNLPSKMEVQNSSKRQSYNNERNALNACGSGVMIFSLALYAGNLFINVSNFRRLMVCSAVWDAGNGLDGIRNARGLHLPVYRVNRHSLGQPWTRRQIRRRKIAHGPWVIMLALLQLHSER